MQAGGFQPLKISVSSQTKEGMEGLLQDDARCKFQGKCSFGQSR